jgi:hypothetical protein
MGFFVCEFGMIYAPALWAKGCAGYFLDGIAGRAYALMIAFIGVTPV